MLPSIAAAAATAAMTVRDRPARFAGGGVGGDGGGVEPSYGGDGRGSSGGDAGGGNVDPKALAAAEVGGGNAEEVGATGGLDGNPSGVWGSVSICPVDLVRPKSERRIC
jgi:hypothetical protein